MAADAIASSTQQAFPPSFDLVVTGGGLAGFYGGAVASVLATLHQRGVLQVESLHGVSSGALVCATFLGCEANFTKLEDVYRCHEMFVRGRWLSYSMRAFLDECLPPDVHERANGRMHVTVTEMLAPGNKLLAPGGIWPRKRVISHFATRAELLDAVMASTIIPGITAPAPHASSPCNADGRSRLLRRGYQLDGMQVAAPVPSIAKPQLLIRQMAAARRLRYPKRWLLRINDADVDVTLALPALKDTVRLLTLGTPLPHQAMTFVTAPPVKQRHRVGVGTVGGR